MQDLKHYRLLSALSDTITRKLKTPSWILLMGMSVLVTAGAHAKSVLIVGDSLSAGYGIDPQNGWVNKLQTTLDLKRKGQHQIINASVSGETSSGGLTRLPKLLKTYKPDIVILELGGNDGLRGQPPAILQSNLTHMIKLSQANHAKVILLGMRIPPSYGSAYTTAFSDTFKTVAKTEKVTFIPFFLEGVAGHPELIQADGIHPRTEAQTRLLQNVLPTIEKILK
ncbi:arylesterase [Aquirhabdus parva]|uniref:Arylesterase n=2 Tax=Aquirhabdus parva TaxID=2283318 RepID=A0A345P6H0_9GAMM|nr:arylesterase [Aquirhabdus parva]